MIIIKSTCDVSNSQSYGQDDSGWREGPLINRGHGSGVLYNSKLHPVVERHPEFTQSTYRYFNFNSREMKLLLVALAVCLMVVHGE